MTALVRIKEKAQITIPSKIRKQLGINCGDFLDIKIEKNRIILIPKIIIDKEIHLSKVGNKKIKEAICDIKEGRIEPV